MAVPNGLPSTAWFEWGTNSAYGHTSSPVSIGAGTSVVRVSTGLSGLAAATAYDFRLVVSNASGGVSLGPSQRFITGGRVKAWGNNWYGQTNVPADWHDIVGVAAGAWHTLVLRAAGTLTESKNSWLVSCSPDMLRIGTMVMPGVSSGTSKKLIPAWGFCDGSVRQISYTINWTVHAALCTRNGHEIVNGNKY